MRRAFYFLDMGTHKKSRHARGYDSKWEAVRAAKLSTDPLCEPCKSKGKTILASQVHHLKRFRDPASGNIDHRLRLSQSNLQSICDDCHKAATADERRADAEARRGVIGCDETGQPLDPNHPWNAS